MCGAARTPFSALTSRTLNLAGEPSRWGGAAASLIGVMVVVFGLTLAASIGLIINAFWSAGVALGVALPFLVLTLVVGGGFLFGGRKLRKGGEARKQTARLETVRALAAHRGKVVTASDVARALQIPVAEADELLTQLATAPDADVTLDLDHEGRIHYLFGASEVERWRLASPARISSTGLAPGQRVASAADAQAEAEAYEAEVRSMER